MSWLDLALMTEVFVTLFVIMDPIGTIPVFLALTGGRSPASMRRAAWQAVTVSFGVIVAFAFFGQQILDYLNISLPALQLAGGLLLLLIALELLTGKESSIGDGPGVNVNVALVPLGTPMMAGPGAIVATMVFTDQIDGVAVAPRGRPGRGPRARVAVALDAVLRADPQGDPGERRPARLAHRRSAAVGDRGAADGGRGAGVHGGRGLSDPTRVVPVAYLRPRRWKRPRNPVGT